MDIHLHRALRVRASADHEHHLSAQLVASRLRPRQHITQRGADELFESLGQFTRQPGRSIRAEQVGEIRDRGDNSMWSFEEHKRSRLRSQRIESRPARAGLGGKKALEDEAIRRQAGSGQGGQHSTGAGNRYNLHTTLARGSDQTKAWVADQRCAGVRDQRQRLARQHLIDQCLSLLPLIVIMQGAHRHFGTDMCQ